MKKTSIILALLGVMVFVGLYGYQKYHPRLSGIEKARSEVKHLVDTQSLQNGDLIFQTSLSDQN